VTTTGFQIMSDVSRLASAAWKLHGAFTHTPYLVQPSVPILYFGDLEAYWRSPLRIVTVGLNPSKTEFPTARPFSRFPSAEHLARLGGSLNDDSIRTYLGALNAYFRTQPYYQWFDGAYRSLLAGMDASFYSDRASTAIHTDLCSPLATDPTWSKLDRSARTLLSERGTRLWHDLVEHLQPDIALVSVAEGLLGQVHLQAVTGWETIYVVERDNPYPVTGRRVRLQSGRSQLLVFGRAAQLPFGLVSHAAQYELGRFLQSNHPAVCQGTEQA
jgi:hypothetical protein